jgi:hypothetical protein
MLRLALAAGAASVAGAGAAGGATGAPANGAAGATMPPGFSWDTLPVHWFSANATSQLSPTAAARIATRHSLVIFNGQSHAYQAPPFGKNSEGKMIAGGEMIRAAADKLGIPRPSVLAYFNSVVGWTAYDFVTWMAENKTRMLHDADGQLHICRKDGNYTSSNPVLRVISSAFLRDCL